MARQPMARKLMAIIVADICGYSRLASIDEEGTIRRVDEMLDTVIKPAIERDEGRFVKDTGDGFIGEFASVSAAFRCALAIQKAFAERNAELPEDEHLWLRIGLDIGDIIIRKDDVRGNGVIIAARLEAMARPGGICLSHRARESLGQFEVEFEDIGKVKLKNIPPVRAYRVGGTELDSSEDAAPPTPSSDGDEETRGWFSRPKMLAGGAVLGTIAVMTLVAWQPVISPPEPRPFFEQGLAELRCSWLNIGRFVERQDGVQFELEGAALLPEESLINEVSGWGETAGIAVTRVNASNVMEIEREQCPLIDNLRHYRNRELKRLSSEEAPPNSRALRVFEISYDPEELAEFVHIYSIDPDGTMQFAQARQELLDNSWERENGMSAARYEACHVGWGGLLLMESDAPIDRDTFMELVEGEENSPAFSEQAERDNWRFELLWINSPPADGADMSVCDQQDEGEER